MNPVGKPGCQTPEEVLAAESHCAIYQALSWRCNGGGWGGIGKRSQREKAEVFHLNTGPLFGEGGIGYLKTSPFLA